MKYLFYIVVVLVLLGLPYKIDIDRRILRSKKIKDTIRICVISDLHCRRFGDKQSSIKKIVDAEKPDLIIMPGDLFDVDRDPNMVFYLFRALEQYPLIYTLGNHEGYMGRDVDEHIQKAREMGVHVLENESMLFQKGDSQIEITGLRDIRSEMKPSPESISGLFTSDNYRILVSHRPHRVDVYRDVDCDLIISGHSHGGQFRIPFTHKGLIGPNEKFFPEYTEGMHNLGKSVLYISRGMATGLPGVPRLFNNPEIGFITLKGNDEEKD
ncbi:MAG: metallophosphoesterase [Solobacterium sp.]|nr:metallophosphoesterase [Solobacterium sp.]